MLREFHGAHARGAADQVEIIVVREGRRVETDDGFLHVECPRFKTVPGPGGRFQREFAAVDDLLRVAFGLFQIVHRPVCAGQQRLDGVEVEMGDAVAREVAHSVVAHHRQQGRILFEVLLGFGQVGDDEFEHLVERTVRSDLNAVALHIRNRLGFGRGVARGERYGEDARHLEVEEGPQGEKFALVEPRMAEFAVVFRQDVGQGLVDMADDLVSRGPDLFGDGDGIVVRPLPLDDVGHVVALVDGEIAGHQLGIFVGEHLSVESVALAADLSIDSVDGVLAAFGRGEKFLVGYLRFGVDIEVSPAAAQQQRQQQQGLTVLFDRFHSLRHVRKWDGTSG